MDTSSLSPSQRGSAPDENRISYFGVTDTRGKHVPFGIKQEDRSRHSYVIGKTGMGKSTLLENLAIQDIQEGRGLCFIDPHGGTAEKLLEYIPEHRVKDVLYFAPFDLQYPISFNVLENVDADKRHFVVAGLMSTFEKIWVDAWSARMAYILQNTLSALLEFPGATLLGVNRMYIDKEYRKNVISKLTDPSTRSFWVDEYSKYTDRYAQEATPAIQNKIGQFASNALVRNIIGQEHSAFDIREMMDTKKIFIANLSKGRVGEGNANLIGSMLITKIYLAAMSRADVSPMVLKGLPPFYLFVDEFQNFANRSFADILSEARKYKLALTVAHQYIEQMEDEVRAAVFGNVGTMMTFRVGSYDADVLEKEFAPVFIADNLVNLARYQLYLKLMIDGVSSQPFSASAMPPIPEPEVSHRDRAVSYSRAQYSRPRAEVEKSISDWTAHQYEDPEYPEKEAARLERRAQRESEAPTPPHRDGRQEQQRRPYEGGGERRDARPSYPTRAPPRIDTRVERFSGNTPPQSPSPHHGWRENERPQPPAPRVSPPRPHVVAPPPHEKRDVPSGDLRSTLRSITPPPHAPQGRGRTVSTPPPQMGAPSSPPRSSSESARGTHIVQFPRDDGKGVTEAGKSELRSLLASLTKQPPAESDGKKTPRDRRNVVPPPTSVAPAPTQRPFEDETPRDTRTPRALSDDALKKVLHVDKPDA